jgi:AcrR family transcriptional regulator
MARFADPQRRTVILQAARKVFLQQGYLEARMTDIGEEAGVAAGTLYLYFDSKESLAEALIEDFFEHLAAQVIPILSRAKGAEILPEIVAKVFSAAEEYHDILNIAPMRLGKKHGKIGRPRLQFVKQIAIVLEDKMKQGVIRHYDPQSLTALITALIQHLVMGCLVWKEVQRKHYKATVIQMLQLALFP